MPIEVGAAAVRSAPLGRLDGPDGVAPEPPAGGPKRWFGRTRSWLPGRRALKTALAVGLAWWFGTLLGEPHPLFAALGALLAMEATVAGSLRRTGLQLAGMLGGLGLAFVVGYVFGANAIGIGLAVLMGLWLGRRVGSADRVGVELGVTTLLVVVLAAGNFELATDRVWETVLGGLVAAVINALVLPPNYLGLVADDLHTLVTAITRGLREATRIFVERPQHEGAAETLERVRGVAAGLPDLEDHLTLAGSALRFSPLLHGRGPVLERSRVAVQLYGRAVQHVATLARIVRDHAERPHPWAHSGLVGPDHLVQGAEALSLALERFEAYVQAGAPTLLHEVRRELERAHGSLGAFMAVAEREHVQETAVRRLVDIAAVASELEHLASDLAATLDGLLPLEQAPTPTRARGSRSTREPGPTNREPEA